MADQGGGQDEAALPYKDTLGPRERRVYDTAIDFLSADKPHAGVAAITGAMEDDYVRGIIKKPDLSEADAEGKRWQVVEIVQAELQRRNPDAVATRAELNRKIVETGLQPYLDIVGSMPKDANYPAYNIGGLMESNTEDNRGKGMNLAHRQFAHAMGVLREAVIANNDNRDGTQATPEYIAKTEIGVVAVAELLKAIDQAFILKGMKPFSVDDNSARRSGSMGDNVLQYVDYYINSIPAGREGSPKGAGLEQILHEVSASKRVNALAPKPEKPVSLDERKDEGPFVNAFERARLAREKAALEKVREDLDNPFDGVK